MVLTHIHEAISQLFWRFKYVQNFPVDNGHLIVNSFFLILLEDNLPAVTQWANENENFLALQENL